MFSIGAENTILDFKADSGFKSLKTANCSMLYIYHVTLQVMRKFLKYIFQLNDQVTTF